MKAPETGGNYRAKLSILLELLTENPLLQKKPEDARKAVALGLYDSFEHAFTLANKGLELGKNSDNAWGLGDDFAETLKRFKEWKTPIQKSYKQLEARTAPFFDDIDKLARNIVAQGNTLAKIKEGTKNVPRFSRSRAFDFFFWSSTDLDRLDGDTRKLLEKIDSARLLLFNEKYKEKLRSLTREFYQQECHIYLRWDHNSTFLRAVQVGHELHKTALKGFEQIEWRLAEEALMTTQPSPVALEAARRRLVASVKQLEEFLKAEACEVKSEAAIQEMLNASKKSSDRKEDSIRRRKRFILPRLFAYLIRVEMLLGREDRAAQVLKSKDTLEKRIAKFAESKNETAKLGTVAKVFKMSNQTMSLPIIEMIRPKLSTMSMEELDKTIARLEELQRLDKGFQHAQVFLISVYLKKALKLSAGAERKAFAESVNLGSLESALRLYQLNYDPYEFYVEWIQGLVDLAELYDSVGQVSDAKRMLTVAKTITENRGHPFITQFNQDIKNRLKRLAR